MGLGHSFIKVIGVGGRGSNAINHMFQAGIKGVDFVVCNTDSQALENSSVPNKIQLGVTLTEGLGAGANPEIGEKAAVESFEEIKQMLDTNTKMIFGIWLRIEGDTLRDQKFALGDPAKC